MNPDFLSMLVVGWIPSMDQMVARLDIDRFRHLLEPESDETERQMLLRLLAAEEAKLKAATKPSEKKNEGE